jgi:hypothetical protein
LCPEGFYNASAQETNPDLSSLASLAGREDRL